MGKLHSWPFAVAMTTTAGIAYIICAVFVILSPVKTINFFNNLFHGIDLTKIIKPSLSFGSVITGFLELIIFIFLMALIFSFLYNLCLSHCIRKGWIKEERK